MFICEEFRKIFRFRTVTDRYPSYRLWFQEGWNRVQTHSKVFMIISEIRRMLLASTATLAKLMTNNQYCIYTQETLTSYAKEQSNEHTIAAAPVSNL